MFCDQRQELAYVHARGIQDILQQLQPLLDPMTCFSFWDLIVKSLLKGLKDFADFEVAMPPCPAQMQHCILNHVIVHVQLLAFHNV